MLKRLVVEPGTAARLAERDPRDQLGLEGKEATDAVRRELIQRLHGLQERLWAEATRSVLLVLQGMDTSGKDGTIEHVFTGVNPQGVADAAFKAPTPLELGHDYLWRVHQQCPARGEIGIFNRSHYEDLVTVRVLDLVAEDVWRRRFRHVREFERLLVDEGTAVVKVFLHISKAEQKERLEKRLADPEKRWKFRLRDLDSRAQWDDYQAGYEEALSETSTDWAPWYVVPADRKWVRNVAIAMLLVQTLEDLAPAFPEPTEELANVTVPE